MKKTFTPQVRTEFDQNRSLAAGTISSIERNFFARTESYLDEIVNCDYSVSGEKTHAFIERLLSGIADEITDFQRELYSCFLYCAFICMERNLLPSFENVTALARNTEIYGQRSFPTADEELAKDKYIPRFGLAGIARKLCLILNREELPAAEYTRSDPSYYDFCRRYGYGTYCRAFGQDFSIHEDNSDEEYERNKLGWEMEISSNVPSTAEFISASKRFSELFWENRSQFRAADIERMFDIFLFTEGKSVLSTTTSRLEKLTSDLQRIDSDLLSERDLLEQALILKAGVKPPLADELSIFPVLKKQDAWINDSAQYISDMLSGMNISFHELISGSTPEESEKRIRRLIEMIEMTGIDRTWSISEDEREMLRCFLYCAMWESLAIRGNAEYSTVKCENFGELLHRVDMAVHFYRYSNAPLTADLLGGTTRTIGRSKPDDTEVHFEHDDDDYNMEFNAELYDKAEYAARAERLRELLRAQEAENPEVIDPEYNMYLYEFSSLISTAVKGFLYSSGLTAFSFGNDFDMIRQAMHKIEKTTNRLRFAALQKTFKAVSDEE